ncbi:MAG TPA: AsmA-like C-terminal region-containing protein, partial [Alphaproteobacteria bacterium]|nr:AsmA-like C-terminal region-containing protein [Alphaproteobacteria bacterium]
PASSEKAQGSQGFLPAAPPLPDAFRGQIKLSAARATYGGQPVKGLTISAFRGDKAPTFAIEAAEIPGKTSLKAQGVWSEDPAAPALDLTVDAKAGYLPETLKFLLGSKAAASPLSSAFETGAAKLSARLTPTHLSLADSTLTLNDLTAAVKGSYALPAGGSGRPSASLTLNAGAVDADALMSKLRPPGVVQDKGGTGAKSDPVSTLRNLTLPFDLTFDLGASSLTWQKQKASGVRLAGSLIGRTLTLASAGAEGWYGARFGAAGKIADLSTLEGIDLRLTGAAANAQTVLDALSLNAQSFPRPFGAAEVAATVKGNARDLRFAANLKALRGSAEATGALSGLLERAPIDSLNALTVRLTHPNLGDLMRMTRSGASGDRSLDRPLDVYARLDREADLYKISGLKANLGPMSVSGDLSLSTAGARPALSGKVQTGSIPLDSFTGAQSTASVSPQAGVSAQPVRWSRNAIDTGWMRAMDLDLGVRATRLRYKGWDLSDPSFTVTLRDGVLSIPDLKAGLFNGTLDLATTVGSAADPRAPLSIDGKAAVAGVGIEPLLHAFTSGLPMKAQGNVSLNTTIAASGVSMAALVNDLSGKGDVSGKDIVLEGVDLPRFARALSSETKPGDTLQGFWKGATSGGATRFDTLTGNYVIEEGVVRIGQLLLDGPQTSINTTGAVNLPLWTVDLKNRITLKEGKEVPPFDVTISGPLDNPANTFGAGVMQDYFARKLNRKIEGLIQDKLGAKLQDKLGLPGFKAPLEAPQQTEPATGGDPPATPEAPGSQAPVQAPAPSAPKPEDLFKDVIRGLAR